MPGTVEAILIAPKHGQAKTSVTRATLAAGGLAGDRHATVDGPGVVSLIESEQVAYFNDTTGLAIDAGITGRNIVTKGIDLNALVGKRFKIGEAELEAFELCDPCASLGASIATDTVPAKEVVKTFVDRAGIRAYVRTPGEIAPGDTVTDAS